MKTETSEHILSYGTRRIPFQLRTMERKRLRITVRPNLSVRADAPDTFSESEILEAMQSKASWVASQLDELEAYHPLPKPHRYVSGETIVYLGRQYRLKIEQGENLPAKLRGKFLHITAADAKDRKSIKIKVEAWYRQRAEVTFARYLQNCLPVTSRHGITEPIVSIRKMRTRWGSCSAKERVTLNLHLIQAPVHCIEYVIMHELCHLKHHNHSPAFYSLLSRCMPDWQKRRQLLKQVVITQVD